MVRNEEHHSRPDSGNRISKEIQIKGNLEMRNLGTQTGTTEATFTNRTQEMEETTSVIEDMIEEMDTSVKENVKPQKLVTQNIREVCDSVKRPPSLKIIGVEEGEKKTQVKGTENTFNKIIEESFLFLIDFY